MHSDAIRKYVFGLLLVVWLLVFLFFVVHNSFSLLPISLLLFFFVVVCILLLVVLSLFANIIFGMYVCVVMWHLNNSARACIDDRFVSTTI